MGKFDPFKMFQRKRREMSGMTITITQDASDSRVGAISGTGAATTADIRALPFIGRLAIKTQYTVAGSLLLALLAGAAGVTYYSNSQREYYTAHYKSVQELRADLLKFNQDALRISSGLDAFLPGAYLERQRVDDGFTYLRATVFKDLPELKGAPRETVDRAYKEWNSGRADFNALSDAHAGALSLRGKLASTVKPMAEALALARDLQSQGGSETAARQAAMLTEGLERALEYAQTSEANVSYGASQARFKASLERARGAAQGLQSVAQTAEARAQAESLARAIAGFETSMGSLLAAVRPESYKAAAGRVESLTEKVLLIADEAENGLRDKINGLEVYTYLTGVMVALMIGALGLLWLINNNENKRRTIEARSENEANQRAIMSLLDEIGNLADGDLTVRATVSEEITGAIADSMNFAITEMATLVGQIQMASAKMERATAGATGASVKLQKINAQQTADITETGRSVLQIAEAIEQVSQRMEDSKRVAKASVESSQRGMDSVTTSIEGIRSIQTNVEETGKRIRRLTEQSKQISEIVDLIADISERTSVLAINATVQATKAGAAGKGFKVVADAVQDLANQASEATRRIGALINAIQTDIQGAGLAMDKTTEEANRGAALAETTGEVLAEISDVSLALADIVAEVNEQVGSSARAASLVSKTMKKVLDSVNESTASTKATGESIEEINELSEQLRDSVAGFKV